MNDDGPSVLGTLCHANWPHRASLVVRHAERYPIESAVNNHHIGLTSKGKADAVEFGARLSSYSKIRLFHSPAKRCRETAEGIAEGAARAGIRTMTLEVAEDLSGGMNVLDESCLRLADRMGQDFVRAWFSGKVDPTTIKELSQAAEDMSSHIVRRLLEHREDRVLDINVSHDWNIMALRENYLHLRHEDLGWLGFLDGLALYPNGSGIIIAYREHGILLGNGGRH